MIGLGPMPPGGVPAGQTVAARGPRLTERHVLTLGLAMAAAFVAGAAFLAGWLAIQGGGGQWAIIHLALAGGATVAIGAFMPHFAVTLAGTNPSPAAQRIAVLTALALAGAGVVAGVSLRLPPLSAAAGALVIAGLAGVTLHTFAPMRQPLARRHPVVGAAYGVALAELALGVMFGTLAAMGNQAVLGAWAQLRPAHAWLTLFGAMSLTIAATLVYLAPTVLGARVRASWALGLMVAGIGIGPILAAAGFAFDARFLVVVGMAGTVLGGAGQVGYLIETFVRRGPFTSEHDWRRVAAGHLLAGAGWFAVASAIALDELLAGRDLTGWSVGLLALPLVAGWVMQELVGSWTHLVPSVTPGDADLHARQRRVLAVGSWSRLVAWNSGLLAAWAGAALEIATLATAGGIVLLAAVATSVVLMGRALTIGRY
ncbi:MAG TPA: hypothetical protein VFW95_00790 [Candidatus Limnocylindria bacterium]|nr:hypothetical protein [Candidatus Limnocylindria bacterium]